MSDLSLSTGVEPLAGAGGQLVGSTIAGRYKVESLRGSGGVGSVYLVHHTHMHKRFALKILNAESARDPEMVAAPALWRVALFGGR